MLQQTCLKYVLTVSVIALKFAKFIGSSSSPDFGLSTLEAFGLPISALFDDLLETGSPPPPPPAPPAPPAPPPPAPLRIEDLIPSASSVFYNKSIPKL